MKKLNFLINATFRSNPEFELIEWGDLSSAEAEALAGLGDNPEIFGVFRKRHASETGVAKIAYTDVALLFFALKSPGNLPQYFQVAYDDEVNETMVKLVLDGVFELEFAERFVSGIGAQELVFLGEKADLGVAQGFLSELSARAIEYALMLRQSDSRSLAGKLYGFNAMPAFESYDSKLDDLNELEHFLGVGKDDAFGYELLKNWEKHTPTENYHWLSWSRKGESAGHRTSSQATYKMYISPIISAMPEVFEKSVRCLTKTKAFSFKTGMDRAGLYRSDKFVVYFHNHQDLMEAALLLCTALKGYEAQGVPFTGALDDTGMLSWGEDPPSSEVTAAEGGSWRAGISEKIAGVISQTDITGISNEAKLNFILNKIALEGINPILWIPN